MTSQRDFDRIAQAWLELGPDEAPDRVIAAVLQAAETTPQVRRPIGRPTWRSFHMNRLPIAAVMAAVVIVIGGGILLVRPGQSTGTGPATASPSPTVPSAAVPAPAALQATWVGPRRAIPGLPASDRYRFTLTASGLAFPDDTLQQSVLVSEASAPAPGQLQLTTTDATVGCRPGDVGRYTWSLSPSGSRLTLVATSDACQGRAAALAGDWFRVGCKNTADGCLGDLQDAGSYSSQYVTPMLASLAVWRPTWGALTYTVPAGWANSSDWPNSFSLTPSSDYARETSQGPPAGVINEIDLYRDAAATAQNGQCSKAIVATVPQTVDGLIGYIRGLKSVVSTSPAAITVAGHPAQWIDVKVAPTWTATCPGVPPLTPAANFLAFGGSSGGNDYEIGLSGKEQQRFIFVDLGGGIVALIAIDSTDPTRFGRLVADAMPIIASFNFK
jgi:hypothetical protein